MHVLLTDILACPRCSPASGLIVRSDEMRDRRVLEGILGCPSCHAQFPIHGGVAHLDEADATTRTTAQPPAVDRAHEPDSDAALRIAALLGATEPLGMLLLIGPITRHAGALASIIENTEIIAVSRDADALTPAAGTSRIAVGARLPFFGGRLRGIWASGDAADVMLEECARALHPLGRLVLEPAPRDAASRLEAAGMRITAAQDDTVLAIRPPGAQIASDRESPLS